MPYFFASFRILSAIINLSSAVFGIPFSSIARPTTAAPYFFARGRILSNFSCSPFTELIMAFPFTTRRPASSASTLEESICKGKSVTA